MHVRQRFAEAGGHRQRGAQPLMQAGNQRFVAQWQCHLQGLFATAQRGGQVAQHRRVPGPVVRHPGLLQGGAGQAGEVGQQGQAIGLADGAHVAADGLVHEFESLVQAFGGFGDLGGVQQQLDALLLAQRAVRPFGGGAQCRQGTGALTCGFPVGRHAGRLGLAAFQPGGTGSMQMTGNDLGQALQHDIVDEIVRKRRATQHMLGFEFRPGIRQFQRTALQQALRQRNVEVDAGHRRDPGELQCRAGQPRQLLADELGQRTGPGQAFGQRDAAVVPGQLERFQSKQGVAAAALVQQGRRGAAADPGQGQRIHQLGHLRLAQRLQRQPGVWAGRGQRVQQGLWPAAGHRGPQAQAPARAGDGRIARLCQQLLQQFHRGVVGEVQVVQHQHRHCVEGMAQQAQQGLDQVWLGG
jgi:hypothetical protein